MISVANAADTLSLKQRRLYDVLNVLESVAMLDLWNTNIYWYGSKNLKKTLGLLQDKAISIHRFVFSHSLLAYNQFFAIKFLFLSLAVPLQSLMVFL